MMEKGIWYNRKGEELRISKMETTHICNCMKMLIGGMYLTQLGIIAERDMVWLSDSLDKYKELLKEYKRRKKCQKKK